MKVTEQIKLALEKFDAGIVFVYSDLITSPDSAQAAIKALNRKVQKGELAKLSKGKFYKPRKSVFGELTVSESEIIKDFLEDGAHVTGYLTGLSIYNQLGLTNQVGSVIQIAKNTVRPSLKRSFYRINFVLQKNKITKNNIPLLQLLDAIRYIKEIPDTSIDKSIERLSFLLKTLPANSITKIRSLSQKYPPSTRALLGLMLELQEIDTGDLLNSLNPVTKYKFNISEKFSNAEKWRIT